MTNDYGNLELHKVLLSAMKDIDKICRENGLKYYIYAGTLLGAVNFKGFIPWDDDVDVVMFPEDFKVLKSVVEKEYAEIYEIRTFENTPDWHSKMNKFLIKGTKMIEMDGKEDKIFIDISTLHSVPNNKILRFFQRKKIELADTALATKAGKIITKSLISKATVGFLSKFSKNFWGNFLDCVMSAYDSKKTEYVAIMCNMSKNPYTGRNGYSTDITKREWHMNYQYVEFEDTKFMTISDYEKDLMCRYGSDYNKPYPEEKRITKHNVKLYEISDEVRNRVGIL